MAEHKDLLNDSAHCHYPRDFSTAGSNTILTKNSSDQLVWEAKADLSADIPHGMSYISASAGTTITTGGTYYQADGTWTNVEAENITWDTDHFSITLAGDYWVTINGTMACDTLNDIAYFDINVGTSIADGQEQGLSYLAANTHAANMRFPIGGIWYLHQIAANTLICPMLTATNDGSVVTLHTLMMGILYVHS